LANDADSIDSLTKARHSLHCRGQLFETYRNYLTFLARLQIGCKLQGKADASDVVQETFMDAHDRFEQFRGRSERELGHWLRTILAHRIAKLVRHYFGTQRRDVRLEQQLSAQLDESTRTLEQGLEGSLTSPSEAMERREMAVLLADALERLPEDHRDVLLLRHFRGLTFEEVAKRMHRTPDGARHLWSRALGQLRRQMEPSHVARGSGVRQDPPAK
jgi:RNA polymerase sigma-70 factor (ECF subfamily)